MLGLEDDYCPFDVDVKVFLNSALMTLQQLGVGPREGFTVTDFTQKWSDLLPTGRMMEAVKTYLYLCVKMAFDPPANSAYLSAMNEMIKEYEWRMSVFGHANLKDDENEETP